LAGRFKSPAIEVDSYLLSCGRYVERNPLEVGMVPAPWDHPWSSCRAHACGDVDALLAPNQWYENLGDSPVARQERWRRFLLDEDPAEATIRRGDWIVGPSAFRGQAEQKRSRPMPRGRGRRATISQGELFSS
jgi:putative transposase